MNIPNLVQRMSEAAEAHLGEFNAAAQIKKIHPFVSMGYNKGVRAATYKLLGELMSAMREEAEAELINDAAKISEAIDEAKKRSEEASAEGETNILKLPTKEPGDAPASETKDLDAKELASTQAS